MRTLEIPAAQSKPGRGERLGFWRVSALCDTCALLDLAAHFLGVRLARSKSLNAYNVSRTLFYPKHDVAAHDV